MPAGPLRAHAQHDFELRCVFGVHHRPQDEVERLLICQFRVLLDQRRLQRLHVHEHALVVVIPLHFHGSHATHPCDGLAVDGLVAVVAAVRVGELSVDEWVAQRLER
ncbi:MAG: hypothetical protein ACK55Z_33515, partial [bacterium]